LCGLRTPGACVSSIFVRWSVAHTHIQNNPTHTPTHTHTRAGNPLSPKPFQKSFSNSVFGFLLSFVLSCLVCLDYSILIENERRDFVVIGLYCICERHERAVWPALWPTLFVSFQPALRIAHLCSYLPQGVMGTGNLGQEET
jgi:hypothetical protein